MQQLQQGVNDTCLCPFAVHLALDTQAAGGLA